MDVAENQQNMKVNDDANDNKSYNQNFLIVNKCYNDCCQCYILMYFPLLFSIRFIGSHTIKQQPILMQVNENLFLCYLTNEENQKVLINDSDATDPNLAVIHRTLLYMLLYIQLSQHNLWMHIDRESLYAGEAKYGDLKCGPTCSETIAYKPTLVRSRNACDFQMIVNLRMIIIHW